MPGSVSVTLQFGDMPVFRGDGMKNRDTADQSEFKICPGNGDPGAVIVVNAGGQTNRATNTESCP
jgi:hypothetical protein